eukprot:TRINITY_DN8576_c0_g1_i1.p1 TRINITY_DN8576_c0_g1~~TRINITY_DN8576_c0_g1_i1.p1  ORF type:complete len:214 (-),score=68.93 TRINITY_DN8576_c0_g1_i1:209-850(-)
MDAFEVRSIGGDSSFAMDEMAGTQREILESLKHLTQKLDAVASTSEAKATRPESAQQQQQTQQLDDELRDLYKELESLEHALNNEREKAASLAEDRVESEAAHVRDIAALEAMLQQVVNERDRLASENRRLTDENVSLKQENLKLKCLSVGPADLVKNVQAYPAASALLDQSIRLDKAKHVVYSPLRPGTPTEQEPDLEQSCGLSSSGSSIRG